MWKGWDGVWGKGCFWSGFGFDAVELPIVVQPRGVPSESRVGVIAAELVTAIGSRTHKCNGICSSDATSQRRPTHL